MLRQQQIQAHPGDALAKQRQQVRPVQQKVHGGGHGAERQRRQKPPTSLQSRCRGGSAAEHGGQQHRFAGVEIQHKAGHGSGSRSGGRGQTACCRQQQGGGQQTACPEAGYLPAIGGQAHAQRQQEPRLLPGLTAGGTVRQGGQQYGSGPENDQRGGAQRPLPRLPLEQICRLHQQRHDHGGSRAEPGYPVQPGGAERGIGAENEDGGGGMAQPRLKIQKKKSAQSGAQQGAEPRPSDAGGGYHRQRPRAVQAVQRAAGQQKSGSSRQKRRQKRAERDRSADLGDSFQGLSLLSPLL